MTYVLCTIFNYSVVLKNLLMELTWYKMHTYINQDYDIVSKWFL